MASASQPHSSRWHATPADLPSIGTMHARAFHHKSDWHREVFPASLAPWWEQRYAVDMADPACDILCIREGEEGVESKAESEAVTQSKAGSKANPESNPDRGEATPPSPPRVLGLILTRTYTPHERGAPSWTALTPPPSIVAPATFAAMVGAMITYREKYMLGRAHMCVEHFGVDGACQGRGIGSRLLARVCEVADERGLDVFVEANEFATGFYEGFGFVVEAWEGMPGGMREGFCVRRKRAERGREEGDT